jgi:hypothetical protein
VDTHVIGRDRSERLPFEARYSLARQEWYNSQEIYRTGHVEWSPIGMERSLLGLFNKLHTLGKLYVLVSTPIDDRLKSKSLDAIQTVLRMNARFEAWTSMSISDDIQPRVAFFFRKAEDATLFQMMWD